VVNRPVLCAAVYFRHCDGVGRRGYADAEIEAVFAKYDADGDSGLNLSEQGRMQRDLEDQKVNEACLFRR